MKRLMFALALVVIAISMAAAAQTGPILDKILFDAKSSQDVGLKDVAAGRSDLFYQGVDGAAYKNLPADVTAKLDVYAPTGASYISLLLNPVPNKAPYTVTVADKTYFNPFAMQKIRFAMNFIINRKQIIDEIMVGAGAPMFTPSIPGQPNSSKYSLLASKFGMTATGNEAKAIADIDAAMKEAAALPENAGKLVKSGQFWTYNGEPVTIKFLIRVDDPTLRLPEGRYVADQIEKAGIKVERLEYDRTKCASLWQRSDPKDYGWNMYTEGWIGGQTNAFWEVSISQMYAPWFSFMPGMGNAGFWQFENADIDKYTQAAVNGRFKTPADYYKLLQDSVDIGLKDAIRIFVAAQTTYYAANKDRFLSRMAWGLGDGIDKWSMLTADVKPGPDGLKTMTMSQFSSRGSLFMSSWDPIGPDGFGDVYTSAIIKECSDEEFEAHPVTGIMMSIRATYSGLKSDVSEDKDGKVVGNIKVPATAILWNAQDQKWESGYEYADLKGDATEYGYRKASNITAMSMATFKFMFGKWHDGRAIDINDYRYALSFPWDVAFKKGPDDKVYEESYAGTLNPNLIRYKGFLINKDNTITVYADTNYPVDEPGLAQLLCPTLMVEASNYGAIVPWEILEAIKSIVAEGHASSTTWAYNSNADFTEVDLLNEKFVGDLKAKLQEFIQTERVPVALQGFVKPADAVKYYKLALDFINAHGHGYISNGAFILNKYDAKNNSGELIANRDPSYPYLKGDVTKRLATDFARIDAIKVPTYKKGVAEVVSVSVSSISYPGNVAKLAAKGFVTVTLVGPTEKSYPAKLVSTGNFAATIPAADLANLKPGSYTIVVEASLTKDAGAVDTANLIIF